MSDRAVVDVAVVGSGIAGLAAAYELQQRGVRTVLLEGAARPGGVALTERGDGWVIDGGPDSLLVQKPAAAALCREVGLGDRLHPTLPPRTSFVLREGVLHPLVEGSFLGFPVRVGALARSPLFSIPGKLRMAMEVAVPAREGDEDESIAAFVRRRFGQEAVDYLAEPLLAGIHAGDAERLSLRTLFPRLAGAEREHGSVMRAFRRLEATPTTQGAFVSLPGGIGELVDAVTRALQPGILRLSTRVTGIHREAGYALHAGATVVQASAVIVCVPAHTAAGLLRGLDTTLAGLCDAIPYASTATVAFGFRREQVAHDLQGTGFVVPRTERSPLLAATWVSSKWPGRAPQGHVLLRAYLGGGRDPHRLDRDDQDLVTAARDALGETLGITGNPSVTRLFRWTRQSPQYEVGHLDRVAAIERRLEASPGLFLAGSGFRAIGIPDCIADARQTAAYAARLVAARATAGLRPGDGPPGA